MTYAKKAVVVPAPKLREEALRQRLGESHRREQKREEPRKLFKAFTNQQKQRKEHPAPHITTKIAKAEALAGVIMKSDRMAEKVAERYDERKLRDSTREGPPVAKGLSHSTYQTVRTSVRQGGKSYMCSGRDYLGNITTSATAPVLGEVLYAQVINPSEFQNTRLAKLSVLYDMWSVRSIAIHYEPAVSTQTAGQIMGYFDRDSADIFPGAGVENIHRAAASPTERAKTVCFL